MTVDIICADCLDVMAGMEENFVDAVVTDPPYGLEFMGKEWDRFTGGAVGGYTNRFTPSWHSGSWQNKRCLKCGHIASGGSPCSCDDPEWTVEVGKTNASALAQQAFHQRWATAALRVLKPGGHLVAFGGTRTHHRLWCALEDAGFEIRDTLCWLYGSGFPKSHNLKGDWQGWGTALKPAWEIVTLARKPYTIEGGRGIIAESLTRLEAQLWSLLPAKAAEESFGLSQSAYAEACGFAQWTAAERNNTRAALCAQMDTSRFVSALTSCLSTVLSWSNTLAALSNPPNTSTTEAETGQTIDWRTLSSCVSGLTPHTIIEAEMEAPGSRCAALPAARYLNAVVVRQDAILELSALAPAISSGQARCQAEAAQGFSPAWEPIVLARKPVSGTVAANVQAHGTGALNVDATRIGIDSTDNIHAKNPHTDGTIGAKGIYGEGVPTRYRVPAGRWPANLILDEEAAAMLDAQSGELHGAGNKRPSWVNKPQLDWGYKPIYQNPDFYVDSGGASRFFYCAKASREERGKDNTHPTVKPLALMRWLVRLVTPPGGLVLDPFVGSGTTAAAAIAEGFSCVGIDSNEEYCLMARERTRQMGLFANA